MSERRKKIKMQKKHIHTRMPTTSHFRFFEIKENENENENFKSLTAGSIAVDDWFYTN